MEAYSQEEWRVVTDTGVLVTVTVTQTSDLVAIAQAGKRNASDPNPARAVVVACLLAGWVPVEVHRPGASSSDSSSSDSSLLERLERAMRIARSAFQVQVGQEPRLSSAEKAEFELLMPGTWDPIAAKPSGEWVLYLKEGKTIDLARAEGGDLRELVLSFESTALQRADRVRRMLAGEDP